MTTTMTDRKVIAKSELTKAARLLRQAVEQAVAPTASLEEREAAMLAAGNEATRLGLQAELQAVSDGCGAEVLVVCARYRRHLVGQVSYARCPPNRIKTTAMSLWARAEDSRSATRQPTT